MKIEIDISEFYFEEGELEESLKNHIANRAIQTISNSIQKKVDDYIEREIKKQIEENMYRQMNSFISEYIKVGTVKSPINNQQVTIEEYVKEKFVTHTGWNSNEELVKKYAKSLGDEMKTRYDLLFASQLVAKMQENGMLKENIADLLLTSSKKS